MTIEDRNLKAGTGLVARYKGKAHKCEVIGTPEGIRYRLVSSNKQFRSPSAAGSHIMGGNACNGWRFWSIEGTEPTPKVAKEPEALGFRRIPGGRAWCNACAGAFKVEAGTTPTTCPKGHTPEGITTEADPDAKAAADEIAVAEQTDALEAEREARAESPV